MIVIMVARLISRKLQLYFYKWQLNNLQVFKANQIAVLAINVVLVYPQTTLSNLRGMLLVVCQALCSSRIVNVIMIRAYVCM